MNNQVIRSNGGYHYLGIDYVRREVEDLLHTTNEFVDVVNAGLSRRVGELINQLIIYALHLADNYDRVRVLARGRLFNQLQSLILTIGNTINYTIANSINYTISNSSK